MTYRSTLIERMRDFDPDADEPAVLDYLQFRNRQCLYAWRVKRAEYEMGTDKSRASQANNRPRAWSTL
jgi:hypothetical protein